MSRFEECLQHVLQHESGFVLNPHDPGGATNLGVTKETWERWVGRPVSVDAIKALTVEQVTPVYREKYWDRAKCGALPVGIDYIVFDAAVNSGPGRAIKFLQETVGTTPDGVLGPRTLGAVQDHQIEDVIKLYGACRLEFLAELKTWPTFGRGWRRRVDEVTRSALMMAAT